MMHDRWRHKTTGECVLLDNRDSFVFNLAHRLWEAGMPVVVVRSDALKLDELIAWRPRALVLSPGPGHPRDAGVCIEAVEHFSGSVPILGVCLGHQAIAEAYGAPVDANGQPRHGKASLIEHDGSGIFDGLPNPLEVGRYHSLSIRGELPHDLRATAWFEDMNMALEHREYPTFGVQFHPESVLTPDGKRMLQNFARLVDR